MEVGGELHAPAALPLGKNPGSRRIEGSVGPSDCRDFMETRKTSYNCRDTNPSLSSLYPSQICL